MDQSLLNQINELNNEEKELLIQLNEIRNKKKFLESWLKPKEEKPKETSMAKLMLIEPEYDYFYELISNYVDKPTDEQIYKLWRDHQEELEVND
jgi:hypothetical protein